MTFKYRDDSVNSSLGVLAIRVAVGLPISLVVGFIGNIFNGIVVPSPAAGDELAFLIRTFVIGFAASTGGMVAWFNVFESKSGASLVWFTAGIGGLIGAVIAYFIGDSFIANNDLYIMNQQLTQTVIMGSAIGATAFAAILSLVSARIQK
jgi:hypothetical protein